MIWACSAAAGVHLVFVLGMSQLESPPGAGGAAPAQPVNVRYLASADDGSPAGNETDTKLSTNGSVPEPSGPIPASASSAVGADGSQPREYFDVSDVDQPASPIPDWSLDPAFLVRNGVRSLKADILISDGGRPDRCTVTSMTPERPSLHPVIERQLCRTRLTPALRRGVPVPSVRHVEILLSQD